MANKDGILEGLSHMGTNRVVSFDGGYFSFAFGNEIAFCINGNYYILNCTSTLFDEVKEKVTETTNSKELSKWWKEKSKEYEISVWSNDFDDLVT